MFWDTMAGHRLSETLQYHLPKIADGLNRRQYTIQIAEETKEQIAEIIDNELKNGSKYVDCIYCNGIPMVLVFEK